MKHDKLGDILNLDAAYIFTSNHLSIFCNSIMIDISKSTVLAPKLCNVEFSVVSSAYKIQENLALPLTILHVLMKDLKHWNSNS